VRRPVDRMEAPPGGRRLVEESTVTRRRYDDTI